MNIDTLFVQNWTKGVLFFTVGCIFDEYLYPISFIRIDIADER